jgi:hypothetical protein
MTISLGDALHLPDGDAIRVVAPRHFDNRPLYGDHRACALLAGERPQFRLLRSPWPCGTLTLALLEKGQALWLHDWRNITARYRAGVMTWTLQDERFPGIVVDLEAACLAEGEGATVRCVVRGAEAGVRVVWAYGGATPFSDSNLFAHADPGMHPSVSAQAAIGEQVGGSLSRLITGFLPDDCRENRPHCDGGGFQLAPPRAEGGFSVWGRCSAGTYRLGDASAWARPEELIVSAPADLPLICGEAPADDELFWSLRCGSSSVPSVLNRPAADMAAARARADRLAAQVRIESPDLWLNAAMAQVTTAMDACWYAPVFVHGAMSWNRPFPGWRSLYGPTALGWIERVREQARYYLASQIRDGGPTGDARDENLRGCLPAADSRYYGRGRIVQDQHMYNMQTVFFDMLIHAWRWSADAELETLLRPALELHLEWMRDCFDADQDGVYESVLDTWASDSMWYNGGGTAQASSYAFNGHRAAAELADRAGDGVAATRHRAQAERIRVAVVASLWSPERAHLGEYLEALGHRRRHDAAGIYTVCLPIDAGLLGGDQALSHVRFGEWGLERVPMTLGGCQVSTSNSVPYTWSVRELDTADTCHLALANYQVGRGDDGWKLLSGCLRESLYRSPVPGGIVCQTTSEPNPHTDFCESVSMMARTIIEGLFGLRPDRPAGLVQFAPCVPEAWDHAALSTPDASLHFRRSDGVDHWRVTLTQAAAIELRVPVPGLELVGVETTGTWRCEPGLGHADLVVTGPAGLALEVSIRWKHRRHSVPLRRVDVTTGSPVRLAVDGARITGWSDPQGALSEVVLLEDGALSARTTASTLPERTAMINLSAGQLHWREAVALVQGQHPVPRPLPAPDARFITCGIESIFNGDLRTLFAQDYRAPRPDGSCASIGYDGWSPWTFPFWNKKPPAIDFSAAAGLRDPQGRLLLPPGVPFAWDGGECNAACTSLWERWPTRLATPLSGRGRRLWLLLAAATNHMQVGLANARVGLRYADGDETLSALEHPRDIWSIDGAYRSQDAFALPAQAPHQAQLGNACRVNLVPIVLRPDVDLMEFSLETLSPEVVVALLAVTIEM